MEKVFLSPMAANREGKNLRNIRPTQGPGVVL